VRHLFPERRIIKCIRASLMLKWIDIQFPEVPKFFLVRHPCAVVLSRMNLQWATDGDIRHFLCQPTLMSDFLNDKVDEIAKAQTDEQKHAIIWCVTNLVPLHQFIDKDLYIVMYENLVQFPEVEIPKLFDRLSVSYDKSIFNSYKQPSSTSAHTSAILSGKKLIDHWKNELSKQQIDNILGIVDQFGLAWVYENLTV
jgi:hypothetical protein